MKRVCTILLAIALLSCLSVHPPSDLQVYVGDVAVTEFIVSDTTSHDEIVITHNDNFTDQGWSGNGTFDDPIVISNLEIASDGACINISNTNLFFVIENCHLTSVGDVPNGNALVLESVQNVVIRDVTITMKVVGIVGIAISDALFSEITIYDTNQGLSFQESEDSTVANCTITGGAEGPAVDFYDSDHCEIIGNQLIGNHDGVVLNSSDWMKVTNNTIVGNSYYGIHSSSGNKKLSAYWNKIGWNGQNALDDGNTKSWDSADEGNWWSDAENGTDYIVPGDANAKDRNPHAWVDDTVPAISTQSVPSDSENTRSLLISAEVTDDIWVDEVILSFSLDNRTTWTNVTMSWNHTHWASAIKNLTSGSEVHYMVYASDYAGNWGITSDESYSVSIPGPFGELPEIEPLAIIGLVGIIAIISTIAILAYRTPSKVGWNR